MSAEIYTGDINTETKVAFTPDHIYDGPPGSGNPADLLAAWPIIPDGISASITMYMDREDYWTIRNAFPALPISPSLVTALKSYHKMHATL